MVHSVLGNPNIKKNPTNLCFPEKTLMIFAKSNSSLNKRHEIVSNVEIKNGASGKNVV